MPDFVFNFCIFLFDGSGGAVLGGDNCVRDGGAGTCNSGTATNLNNHNKCNIMNLAWRKLNIFKTLDFKIPNLKYLSNLENVN